MGRHVFVEADEIDSRYKTGKLDDTFFVLNKAYMSGLFQTKVFFEHRGRRGNRVFSIVKLEKLCFLCVLCVEKK